MTTEGVSVLSTPTLANMFRSIYKRLFTFLFSTFPENAGQHFFDGNFGIFKGLIPDLILMLQ